MAEKKPSPPKNNKKRADNMTMLVQNEYWSDSLNVHFQVFPKN